jgi:hypothetical protein
MHINHQELEEIMKSVGIWIGLPDHPANCCWVGKKTIKEDMTLQAFSRHLEGLAIKMHVREQIKRR